ncbi:methylthioribose-1-phosphate isomerase [Clostridia bacterium]|nr:methylthioribose-1-phosphate isomerase [Clostridia bacterium]
MHDIPDTVRLDGDSLVIIDQTLLPGQVKLLRLHTQEEIRTAIRRLQVRGAPAIGVAAAIGIYLATAELANSDYKEFLRRFKEAKNFLNSARPTAVNLSWALNRMESCLMKNSELSVAKSIQLLRDEAVAIWNEDIDVCRRIGDNGLALVEKGCGILTHCNAGRLCAVRYGTATAPIYLGHERGYNFHVYADETRPLLQGARLTTFELAAAGVDVTLICDNMAATVMKQGLIQAIFMGCDRVAANGDTANKIGTLGVAILAKQYNIPFYICAPSSTIDRNTPTGVEIEIEERDPEEVTEMWYLERMAPDGVSVYNPSFDVTDADLITGIVTEHGVMRPPYWRQIP